MPIDPSLTRYYRRARFTTRLPTKYQFAPSHFWLETLEPDLFRIGLTHFATRMLGDFVECEFTTEANNPIKLGQPIGWIEGFKALSDIYSVIDGNLIEPNAALKSNPEFVDKDPYDRGWLFIARGIPDRRIVDAEGYVQLLDVAIDRILSQEEQDRKKC
jgi:glycine cleavage system H protein